MVILPPKIDERDQQIIVHQLKQLIHSYCPEWNDVTELELDNHTNALIHIFARMMEIAIQRLNKAPDKNLLSFLDLVGVRLLPPRVARAPLTFTMAKGAANYGFIPAGTQVASVPEKGEPAAVFETEKDLTIILPKLVKGISLDPETDKWRDHSPILFGDTLAEKPEKLFTGTDAIPHRLYLGHQKLFGQKQPVTVSVIITFKSKQAFQSDDIKWYCYDSDSGEPVLLNAACLEKETTQDSIESRPVLQFIFKDFQGAAQKKLTEYQAGALPPKTWTNHWIFAELAQPVTIFDRNQLPEIDTIKAQIEIKTGFSFGAGTVSAVPDSKTQIKGTATAFLTDRFQENDLLTIFTDPPQITFIKGAVTKNDVLMVDALDVENLPKNALYTHAVRGTGKIMSNGDTGIKGLRTQFTKELKVGYSLIVLKNNKPNYRLKTDVESVKSSRLVTAIESDTSLTIDFAFDFELKDYHNFYYSPPAPPPPDLAFYNKLPLDLTKDFYPFGEKPKFNDTFYFGSKEVFSKAGAAVFITVKLSEGLTVKHNKPKLFWEFWNGKAWSKMAETTDTKVSSNCYSFIDTTKAFTGDGQISFICPEIKAAKVNGEENYWLRVRLVSGDYGQEATYTATTDPKTGQQLWQYVAPTYKPPSFGLFTLAYRFSLSEEDLETVLTYNDFHYQDQTGKALAEGGYFTPFQPAPDRQPAFYLAFDQDISTLPVTLFLPLVENYNGNENTLAFDTTGPEADSASVKLKHITHLKVGDPVVFRNSLGETEERRITRLNLTSRLIYWEKPLQKNYNESGSAVFRANDTPVVAWEYWTGRTWSALSIEDGTINLTRKEIIQFQVPEGAASCYLFGFEYYWIRARLEKGNYLIPPRLSKIYTNTVRAQNVATIKDEILGSSNGKPGQTFKFSSSPVLPGQKVLVREIALTQAERAAIIEEEGADAIIEIPDQAGNIIELWVRWHEVNNFNFSQANSRHYTLDRNNGIISFGDAIHGMIPPVVKNNIKCEYYQSGGGANGNVKAGTIAKLRTTFPYVDSVTNPEAASGGSDQEDLDRLKIRGSQTVKNRERAVTYEDFEWLVREASTNIAKVKCLPTTGFQAKFEPGAVTVVIAPDIADDPKPLPSREFLSEIDKYLRERAAVDLGAQTPKIRLIGPGYIRVGVRATVKFSSISNAKIIEGRVTENLRKFFHPLRGGPENAGWDFGRNVYQSEVYEVIENTAGVDYVTDLVLQASVQSYRIKLTETFHAPVVYPKLSAVTTIDGKVKVKLMETVSDRIGVDLLSINGFKEGQTIMISNSAIQGMCAGLIVKTISGDILECEAGEIDRAMIFPIGSSIETMDSSICSYTFNEVTVSNSGATCFLKVAQLEEGSQVIIIHRDESHKISAPLTIQSIKYDTVFLDENELIYAGNQFINKNDEAIYPGIQSVDDNRVIFPYLINYHTREVHDLTNTKLNCQINEIHAGHRQYLQRLDKTFLAENHLDYCYWCFGPGLSKS
ncbi:MAG: putative baseplate assembly protein [Firmicutes bacterium]|nr:putative baseplate assembly protein [Bacillota bacterium]